MSQIIDCASIAAFKAVMATHGFETNCEVTELFKRLFLSPARAIPSPPSFTLFNNVYELLVPNLDIFDYTELIQGFLSKEEVVVQVRRQHNHMSKLTQHQSIERWKRYLDTTFNDYDAQPQTTYIHEQLRQHVHERMHRVIAQVSWNYTTLFFESEGDPTEYIKKLFPDYLKLNVTHHYHYHSSGAYFDRTNPRFMHNLRLCNYNEAKVRELYEGERLAHFRLKRLCLLLAD